MINWHQAKIRAHTPLFDRSQTFHAACNPVCVYYGNDHILKILCIALHVSFYLDH